MLIVGTLSNTRYTSCSTPKSSFTILNALVVELSQMGNLIERSSRRRSSGDPLNAKDKISLGKSKSNPGIVANDNTKSEVATAEHNGQHRRVQSLRDRRDTISHGGSIDKDPTMKSSECSDMRMECNGDRAMVKRPSVDIKSKGSFLGLKSSKKEPKITPAQKTLLRESWETSPHGEIGIRIYARLFQKRPDIKQAYDVIALARPGHTWKVEAAEFTEFVNDLIYSLEDVETVQEKCWQRGRQYAPLREFGFKPQFWVPMSEIMTTECLYLDRGLNPVADVVDAWAALISLMLSYMRDGFYAELRIHRRESKRRLSRQKRMNVSSISSYNLSNSDSFDLSIGGDDSDTASAYGRLIGRKNSESEESGIGTPQIISPNDALYYREQNNCMEVLPRGSTIGIPMLAFNPGLAMVNPRLYRSDECFATPPTSPPHQPLNPCSQKLTVIEDVNENLIG